MYIVLGDNMLQRFEQLLYFAISNKSTDIHFEINPKTSELKISLRTISGFKQFESKPIDFRLIEHLKYISNLNLIKIDKPQSGSFTYHFNEEQYYFRLATIKSQFLEVSVLRILNKQFVSSNIFNEIASEINELMKRDSGLIIFSGPTGSGKTTSMYTLMNLYDNKMIYSIEDPIEIYFDNLVQVDINESKGFTYSEAIKQILRHDPDIICIGEIRDENAASMAIRAAYTGHLVLCTIHAKNVDQTIERLIDLGISKSDIDDNVIYIANQRLIVDIDNQRKSVYETIIF